MINKKVSSLMIMFLLFSTFVTSQTKKDDLNLEQCIQLALKNNNTFNKSKLDLQKAEEQVREAYGTSLFPSIEGTVNYNRAIKKGVFNIETPFFSGSFPVGSKNTLTTQFTAEQPLFTGAMFLAVRIAETFSDISKRMTEYSEGELILNVKSAYYTHLLSNELVKLTELQLKRAEENLKNVSAIYDAGLVSEYDYIKANVQYQNSKPALTESQNQLRLSLNNLKLLIGTNLEEELKISDSLLFKEYKLPEFYSGLSQALNSNKIIQQSELQTKLQDLVVSYRFSEHLPRINAFGNWQIQAQEEDSRSFSNWRYVNSIGVGITLKVPIFKGFSIDSKVEQAKIDYQKSIEDYQLAEKKISNDYQYIYNNIKKLSEQISAYESAVYEAERGYEIAVKRYNTGLGTQIELTDALVSATNAKFNYLKAINEYKINTAQYDFIMGKSTDEIIQSN
jgi:outer membrane protein TolC